MLWMTRKPALVLLPKSYLAKRDKVLGVLVMNPGMIFAFRNVLFLENYVQLSYQLRMNFL